MAALQSIYIANTMLAAALVALLGLIVAWFMAPEAGSLSLQQASLELRFSHADRITSTCLLQSPHVGSSAAVGDASIALQRAPGPPRSGLVHHPMVIGQRGRAVGVTRGLQGHSGTRAGFALVHIYLAGLCSGGRTRGCCRAGR